ncbi:Uncharacterized protein FKW44_013739 [Caligus rogercresseyi]|uniref:Protein kinase domain-containing protein n=1 Tax=Caligus rogercresseyi TaxID=217165 RepID=A0A7T8GYS9_CALRO|nr:Uncharacterized protein FKW44_013739 [Caligus rogercresseyi]
MASMNLDEGVNRRMSSMVITKRDHPFITAGNFHSHFNLLEVIGRGSNSIVKKCVERRTDKVFAVKVIALSDLPVIREEDGLSASEQVENEIDILQSVKGYPYIAEIHKAFRDSDRYYLVFKWYPRGDLFEVVSNTVYMSERRIKRYFHQVLRAIRFCHSKRIIHRDIKLENILLDNKDNVRLTDFGLSRRLNPGEQFFELCGTDTYFAPEAIYVKFISRSKVKGYKGEVDVWACGVLLYSMIYKKPPFTHPDRHGMLQNILRGRFAFEERKFAPVSPLLKHLIRRCLTVQPKLRIRLNEAMEHPAFVFNAKRRFRIAVWSVIFAKSLQRNYEESSTPPIRKAYSECLCLDDLC